MNNLNKENFWNQLQSKHPKATEKFYQWIDEYKVRVDWDYIFNNAARASKKQIKFHDIPLEMQMGILTAFVSDQIPEYRISTELQDVINSTEEFFRTLENKMLKQ